ncbi:hypothetical protein [Pseudophaeobacter sp. TrK17]|jgi:hypothetical protein|uniref:hypothetical protein n=1 Tax=Pseudophaeobacter sp. TrK17 TaxID=2815167 RepID=UPI0035CED260
MSMSRFPFFASLCALSCLPISSAQAQSWESNDWRNPQGLHALSVTVVQDQFALEISCTESAAETNELNLMFLGTPLPELMGTDGQEETLLVSLKQPDGSTFQIKWPAYYFDGGSGDQAWLGAIQGSSVFIQAFASAQTVELLNEDQAVAYSFPAKGTQAASQMFWSVCGIS